MKIKKIIGIISIVIAILVIISLIAFFAYQIGKLDMLDETLNCADSCGNWVGNIKGQCFDTCVWHKTHDIGFAKIG